MGIRSKWLSTRKTGGGKMTKDDYKAKIREAIIIGYYKRIDKLVDKFLKNIQ